MSSEMLDYVEDDEFNNTISFEMRASGYAFLTLIGDDDISDCGSQTYCFQATEKDADKAVMIANALTSWAEHVKNVLCKKESE
jgi:hypothetical protein